MVIVQINCVFNSGSTGKIVKSLHETFTKEGYQSYVFYGRGKKSHDSNVFKISSEFEAKIHSLLSRLFGVDFGYSYFSTKRAIRLIKKIKPDVVHLHCLNGHFINVYKLLAFLKKNKIKTVLTLHAEIMHTAGCEHALECNKYISGCFKCDKIKGIISSLFRDDAKYCYGKIKQSFYGFNNLTVIGCSKWVMERAKQSSVFSGSGCSFGFIHNDVDLSIFKYNPSTNLKERLNIPKNKKIVLTITSNFNHPIKGSQIFIEICKRLPDIQFVVVGFNAKGTGMPDNLITIGRTSNQKELADYYSIADCFISTSLRETLPTVCLEATACGCFVLAFDSGGTKETIAPNQGDVVKPYCIDEFVQKIKIWVNKEKCKRIDNGFKTFNMASNYLKLYYEKQKENS